LAVKQRGPYKQPERMRTMQDIRILLIEDYTYDAIMQQLHLAPRTFYRYLSAVFVDDRHLLAENISDEEVLNQMAICRDRLLKQRRDILEQIINNPDADDKARIAAHHLVAEIAAAVLRLYTEGPAVLASRHNSLGLLQQILQNPQDLG
jgi:AraC-like DNA-binding protein